MSETNAVAQSDFTPLLRLSIINEHANRLESEMGSDTPARYIVGCILADVRELIEALEAQCQTR